MPTVAARFAELGDEWRRLYGNRVLALLLGAFALAVLVGARAARKGDPPRRRV